MVSVAVSNDELLAKQQAVKVGKTDNNNCPPGGCVKPAKKKDDLFGINKPQKSNPFGNFDINENGKLDPEELAAMKAYIESLVKQKGKKPKKIDKPDSVTKPDKVDRPDISNNEFLLIIIGMLIAQMLQQQQSNQKDLLGNNDKEGKKPLLEVA